MPLAHLFVAPRTERHVIDVEEGRRNERFVFGTLMAALLVSVLITAGHVLTGR